MNSTPCRRHCFVAGVCILCAAADEHRHCYEDRHACAWYEPLEHDAPRRPKR